MTVGTCGEAGLSSSSSQYSKDGGKPSWSDNGTRGGLLGGMLPPPTLVFVGGGGRAVGEAMTGPTRLHPHWGLHNRNS